MFRFMDGFVKAQPPKFQEAVTDGVRSPAASAGAGNHRDQQQADPDVFGA